MASDNHIKYQLGVMFLGFQEETRGTLTLKNKRALNSRELKDTGCGLGVVWGYGLLEAVSP